MTHRSSLTVLTSRTESSTAGSASATSATVQKPAAIPAGPGRRNATKRNQSAVIVYEDTSNAEAMVPSRLASRLPAQQLGPRSLFSRNRTTSLHMAHPLTSLAHWIQLKVDPTHIGVGSRSPSHYTRVRSIRGSPQAIVMILGREGQGGHQPSSHPIYQSDCRPQISPVCLHYMHTRQVTLRHSIRSVAGPQITT